MSLRIQQEALEDSMHSVNTRFDAWERPTIPFNEKELDSVCDFSARDTVAKVFDPFRPAFMEELTSIKNDMVADLRSKGHTIWAEEMNETQMSYDEVTEMLLSYVGGNDE